MVFKHDMGKTYDRLGSDFLTSIMSKFGFQGISSGLSMDFN